jgi:hypothetical protein
MFLLVVQVLQLQVETVDLLSGLRGGLLCIAYTENGVPILTAELGEKGKEHLLLFGNGQ